MEFEVQRPEARSALNEISGAIVDAATEVHRELVGPGLLESVYEEALALELADREFSVRRQVGVPVVYKGRRISADFKLDILVENSVVVECKATSMENPVFESQALTYLRLADLRLALVVNFGKRRIIDGIRRVVNDLR